MGVFATEFVSKEGEKNLRAYKYSGSDASLLYKHFFSPCAQFLVDHVIPPWLAPNVITLVGFMCTLIPHLIVLFGYSADLYGDVPAWLCFVAAFGQLVYMILDNADGKQARKTGSSSPLGLLFDHGCDAMNTFISGMTVFRVVQFGNTASVALASVVSMTTFFCATWEEYYVDALNLPIINGANEGIVVFIMVYFISGIFGCQIWNQQIGSLTASQIVLIAFAAMALLTIGSNMVNIYRHDKTVFWKAIFNLTMVVYLDITMIIVTYCSNTDVIESTPRYLLYFIGFSFAKLVGHLQASHVAHEEFWQFRKSIVFSCTFLIVQTLAGPFKSRPHVNEYILLGCFIYALIIYIHFVINITAQFSRALGIYVFKLGKREENNQNLLNEA